MRFRGAGGSGVIAEISRGRAKISGTFIDISSGETNLK